MTATSLLTVKKVAERWDVDVRTVQQLAARQQLRAMKVGRVWRFSEADVAAYEARQMTVAEPAVESVTVTSAPSIVTYSDDTYRELWGVNP